MRHYFMLALLLYRQCCAQSASPARSTVITENTGVNSKADAFEREPTENNSDATWKSFQNSYLSWVLDGEVDYRCFLSCWERWLPEGIRVEPKSGAQQALKKIVTVTDLDDFMPLTSDAPCASSIRSRAFQRCYVSSCGGFYTNVPVEEGFQGLNLLFWALSNDYIGTYIYWKTEFMEKFFTKDHDVFWVEIPLGITASCFKFPNQTFSNWTDHEVSSMRGIWITQNRMKVPLYLRRLLMPIWTSPNLLDYWSYNLKLDHIDKIDEPRSLMDLRNKIISTYLFAFIAFAHLLSMSSKSHRYIVEGCQLLAFCLVPLFPGIQLFHNALDAVLETLLGGSAWEFSYLLAGVSGTVVFQEKTNERPFFRGRLLEIEVGELTPVSKKPRDMQWILRTCGILANLAVVLVTAVPYFIRINYEFGRATFCAATGFDHRIGWIATSALLPLLQTLILHLQHKEWELWSHVHRTDQVSDWRPRLALDLIASVVLMELLLTLTGRITVSLVVFGRLLQGRGYLFFTILSGLAATVASAWPTLSILYSRRHGRLRRVLKWLLILFGITYAVSVFLLQIFMDMEEFADLALEFVLPWNYRWQIRNPSWAEWWGL